MIKQIRHISLLFVLLIGILVNVFARNLVQDASKISVENRIVVQPHIGEHFMVQDINIKYYKKY